nr:Formate dehydrogenase N alpha subunit selenocysteine-containing [Salmonella sp. NCTC 7297]
MQFDGCVHPWEKKRKAMDVSRRQFFKICAGGMAGTTVAALGFTPKMALAQARNYKLLRAKRDS